MANILKPLGLAALIALASPAAAQDTTPAEDPNAGVPELDMGAPAADAPAEATPIETYVDGVFDDWSRECLRNPEGDDPCQITQVLFDSPERTTPAGKISVGRLPEGNEAEAGSMIILPLGTLLTQQITIQIDSAAPRRYPFRYCDRVGCVAQIGFTGPEVAGMKAGNVGKITIAPVAAPDARIDIPVSLAGFTKAYASLATPGSGGTAEEAPAAEDAPAEEAPATE